MVTRTAGCNMVISRWVGVVNRGKVLTFFRKELGSPKRAKESRIMVKVRLERRGMFIASLAEASVSRYL